MRWVEQCGKLTRLRWEDQQKHVTDLEKLSNPYLLVLFWSNSHNENAHFSFALFYKESIAIFNAFLLN